MRKFIGNLMCVAAPAVFLFGGAVAAPVVGATAGFAIGVVAAVAVFAVGLSRC